LPDEKDAFDVFLSHNSKDKPAVRLIADALENRGIRVWLDERELIPGRPWIPELERIIGIAPAVAVFVGENGIGPWEQPEIEGALIKAVKRGIPVIPVLLPNAPADLELPLFLQRYTWVNLSRGLSDAGLDSLEFGVTGNGACQGSCRLVVHAAFG
jgi:hypothetical protein